MRKKERIAIIGGGLGGCLSALMLARLKDDNGEPKYDITLIEAQDKLLNGASLIASRLHLGGEYPLSFDTAKDCLIGATMWKLLMPKDIYTPAPPMKFLVAQETQEAGKAAVPENKRALTLQKYKENADKVWKIYEPIFSKIIQNLFGGDLAKAEAALFGSFKAEDFFRPLNPCEYANYNQGNTKIAGGFQSQEIGLNVPKYLAMIQAELESQPNITIRKNCKVAANGILGTRGEFTILDDQKEALYFDQVVQAAWQGGPEITPQINQGHPGDQDGVQVYQRAMLLINLPRNWETPPAFIMLGEHGGMLSPYNDKIAVCYLPVEEAAYCHNHLLTEDAPSLPGEQWIMSDSEKKKRTKTYFELLKERFPVLKDLTFEEANPRLIVRDTLNFQYELEKRHHNVPIEVMVLQQGMRPSMEQSMRTRLDMEEQAHKPPFEIRQGHFVLYPTKATYAVNAALQIASMVEARSINHEEQTLIPPPSPEEVLGQISTPEGIAKYSLKDMKVPTSGYIHDFIDAHGLDRKMLESTWPALPHMQDVDSITQGKPIKRSASM